MVMLGINVNNAHVTLQYWQQTQPFTAICKKKLLEDRMDNVKKGYTTNEGTVSYSLILGKVQILIFPSGFFFQDFYMEVLYHKIFIISSMALMGNHNLAKPSISMHYQANRCIHIDSLPWISSLSSKETATENFETCLKSYELNS